MFHVIPKVYHCKKSDGFKCNSWIVYWGYWTIDYWPDGDQSKRFTITNLKKLFADE